MILKWLAFLSIFCLIGIHADKLSAIRRIVSDVQPQSIDIKAELESLLMEMPSPVLESYPSLEQIDILPIDVILRIPSDRFMGQDNLASTMARIANRFPNDPKVIDFALTMLSDLKESDKVLFIDSLSRTDSEYLWKRLGNFITKNGWWKNWRNIVRALEEKSINGSGWKILLEMSPDSYFPCCSKHSGFCLDINKLQTYRNTTKFRFILRNVLPHWIRLPNLERIHRFRFWNSMLRKCSGRKNGPIDPEVAEFFINELFFDQVLWILEGKPLDGEDLPLLSLLSRFKDIFIPFENYITNIPVIPEVLLNKIQLSDSKLLREIREVLAICTTRPDNLTSESRKLPACLTNVQESAISSSTRQLTQLNLRTVDWEVPLISSGRIFESGVSSLQFLGIRCIDQRTLDALRKIKSKAGWLRKLERRVNEEGTTIGLKHRCDLSSRTKKAPQLANKSGFPGFIGWHSSQESLAEYNIQRMIGPYEFWSSHDLANLGDGLFKMDDLSWLVQMDLDEMLLGMMDVFHRSELLQLIAGKADKEFLPCDLDHQLNSLQYAFSLYIQRLLEFNNKLRTKRGSIYGEQCSIKTLKDLRIMLKKLMSLTESKIEKGVLNPTPQMGPFLMNLMESQKNILIEEGDFPNDQSLDYYDEHVEKISESSAQDTVLNQAMIDDLKKLLLQNVKQLVLTGNIHPEDLENLLLCHFHMRDIYTIFPLHLVDDQQKFTRDNSHNIGSFPDTSSVSRLLSVLHFGSSSASSHFITDQELSEGQRIVAVLHSAMKMVSKTSVSSIIQQTIQHRKDAERIRFQDRLDHIFQMNKTDLEAKNFDSQIKKIEKDAIAKRIWIMEKLCFHYRVIREIVGIMDVMLTDLDPYEIDELPTDVVLDLFPTANVKNMIKYVPLTEPYEIIICILYRQTNACHNSMPDLFQNASMVIPAVVDMTNATTNEEMLGWLKSNTNQMPKILRNNPNVLLVELLFSRVVEKVNELSASASRVQMDNMAFSKLKLIELKSELIGNSNETAEVQNNLALRLALDTTTDITRRLSLNAEDFGNIQNDNDNPILRRLLKSSEMLNKWPNDAEETVIVSACQEGKNLTKSRCLQELFDRMILAISKTDAKKLNKPLIDEWEQLRDDERLPFIQAKLAQFEFSPKDIGYNIESATKNAILRDAFQTYFKLLSQEQSRILLIVDALFKETKALLMSSDLSAYQIKHVRDLQRRMNDDSIRVARNYLDINDTDGEDVRRILDAKVRSGNLSDTIIDEVNEFALLQKVYIIMKLVSMLDLRENQFNATLIQALPTSYVTVMFQGQSFSRPRRNLDGEETVVHLSLEETFGLVFHLYHRAIALASARRSEGKLSDSTVAELKAILDSQRTEMVQRLSAKINDTSVVHNLVPGFILLSTSNLNEFEQKNIAEEIIKLQLKVTKQIILLLDLRPDDFFLQKSEYHVTRGILNYLFGLDSATEIERDYHEVNKLYSELRGILSAMAFNDSLSAKQTIVAKGIIHDLNTETVDCMVDIFNIHNVSINPVDLIEKIKRRLLNPSPEEVEKVEEVKTIINDKKIKAIKQLILLLDLKESSVTTKVSESLTRELFSPDDLNAIRSGENVDNIYNDFQEVFCMACFHRIYEEWKRSHHVEPEEPSEEVRESSFTSNQLRGRMMNPGDSQSSEDIDFDAEEAIQFLNDNLHDLQDLQDYDPIVQKVDVPKVKAQDVKSLNVGLILELYQECIRLKSELESAGNLSREESALMDKLLHSQGDIFFRNVPASISSELNLTTNSFPFGIVINTGNMTEDQVMAVQNYTLDFYVKMVSSMVAIMGLTENDFHEVEIPRSLAKIIFLGRFSGEDHHVTLQSLFDYLQREFNVEVAKGDIDEFDALAIDEAIRDYKTKRSDRFGDMVANYLSGRFDDSLIKEASSSNMIDLVNLSRILMKKLQFEIDELPKELRDVALEVFLEKPSSSPSSSTSSDTFTTSIELETATSFPFITTIRPDEKTKENTSHESFEAITTTIDSSTDSFYISSSSSHLNKDETIPSESSREKGKGSSATSIKPTAKASSNSGAGFMSWLSPKPKVEGRLGSWRKVRPIDFYKPIDSSTRKFPLNKRSLEEYGLERVDCQFLRGLGVPVVPLSGELISQLHPDTVLDCADLIFNSNFELWHEMLLRSNRNPTKKELLSIIEKAPKLIYANMDKFVFRDMETLTFLANHTFLLPGVSCDEFEFQGKDNSYLQNILKDPETTNRLTIAENLLNLPCFLHNVNLTTIYDELYDSQQLESFQSFQKLVETKLLKEYERSNRRLDLLQKDSIFHANWVSYSNLGEEIESKPICTY